MPGIFDTIKIPLIKTPSHVFDISKDERPVITVSIEHEGDNLHVEGGLVFVNSKETVIFDGILPHDFDRSSEKFPFKTATLTRRRTGKVLAVCENGIWAWVENKEALRPSMKMLRAYLIGVLGE